MYVCDHFNREDGEVDEMMKTLLFMRFLLNPECDTLRSAEQFKCEWREVQFIKTQRIVARNMHFSELAPQQLLHRDILRYSGVRKGTLRYIWVRKITL